MKNQLVRLNLIANRIFLITIHGLKVEGGNYKKIALHLVSIRNNDKIFSMRIVVIVKIF